MFERQLSAYPSRMGQDRALVGLSVSFGVHALAFGALIAGAWLAAGSIHPPARRFRPFLPPLVIQEPPAAVAAPLPRSATASRPEKEPPRPDEPIPEMVQPEVIPEVLPEMDRSEVGEADEVWDEGIPDGSVFGIPGGNKDGIPGGVRDGDPNGTGRDPGVHFETDEALILGGVIRKPVKIYGGKPDYPEHARIARLEGNVSLEVIVDREGRVESVRVLSGNVIFREAAVEAVREWRYRPALQNGTPVKVVMSVLVEFRLR